MCTVLFALRANTPAATFIIDGEATIERKNPVSDHRQVGLDLDLDIVAKTIATKNRKLMSQTE